MKPYTALVRNPRADMTRPYGARECAILGGSAFDTALAAIRRWPGYAPTPLYDLHGLAATLGVRDLHYKDEGERFGLKSFKALGGAYAVSRLAARSAPHTLTVTCATDGNHGRSVAWGAQRAGSRCVIFVHGGVSRARIEAIEQFGAEVRRVPGNYDDSVRHAARVAAEEGWTVVSDTSYAGYTDIPRDVMQGYTVLVHETLEQMHGLMPTHLFVQGGVGGLAAAVAAYFWEHYGAQRPVVVVVEPDRADCLLRSAVAGAPQTVSGSLDTVMAGLACGEPSLLAWEILQYAADAFISIPDESALATMQQLAAPPASDPPIVSGESGAAGLAGLIAVAGDPAARSTIALTPDSRVLVIGSESDTDPELYKRIVGRSAQEVRSSRKAA